MTTYTQLTLDERITMMRLRWQGVSFTEIGQKLGRHRSTIYREFERNSCHHIDGGYRPTKAERRTRARRSRSRKNLHYSKDDFSIVRKLLRKDWSPEQITGYLKSIRFKAISHETIYQYIWRDKANGGLLWKHLRQSPKQRRKRYKAYDSRGRLAGKRNISERHSSIETRKYKGHWEIDTVMGKGSLDCIVTLVERKTGFTMIGKLKDRTTASLNKKTKILIKRDLSSFKTITADNGTEFNRYKEIEKNCNTRFFFANPYHSWERGTNENTNGLIRQYLPKGTSMENLTQQQCDSIALKLNQRPRKRHQYKTPEELYYEI